MKRRDMTLKQLAASADRCHGCKAYGNDATCKAATAQGACPQLNGGKFPATWGQLRPRDGEQPKLDQRTKDFIAFFEGHGATFIDGATGRTLSSAPATRLICSIELSGMRLVNPLNSRQHWRTVWARSKKQRATAYAAICEFVDASHRAKRVKRIVTITRCGAGTMDSQDNLRASAKPVVDGIADAFDINDKSALWDWKYKQKKTKRGEYGVEIKIEEEER